MSSSLAVWVIVGISDRYRLLTREGSNLCPIVTHFTYCSLDSAY